jgi:hypothetical protein
MKPTDSSAALTDEFARERANLTRSYLLKLQNDFIGLARDCREFLQAQTKEEMREVIHKLDSGQSLSPEDAALIRSWIIGGAEDYLRLENNYPEWKAELGRVVEQLEHFIGQETTLENAQTIRALAEDGLVVLTSLLQYRDKEEQVANFANFDQALNVSNPDKRETLAAFLRNMMGAPSL